MKQKLHFLLMGLLCLSVSTYAQLIEHKMDNLWLTDVSGNDNHTSNTACFLSTDVVDAGNMVLDCTRSGKVAVKEASNSEGTYSINLWFYLNSTTSPQRLFHKGGKGGFSNYKFDYSLVQVDNRLRFQVGGSDGFAVAECWTNYSTIFSGEWYMVTCTYNHTNMTAKLYLNGVLYSSVAHTVANTSTTQPLNLGYYYSGETQGVDGYMDDVSIYDKELSASEIDSLYNKTDITDQLVASYNFESLFSKNEAGQNIVTTGGSIVNGTKEQAILLDNSSLDFGNINLTNHTFNIWFKTNSIGIPQRILHKGGQGGSSLNAYSYSLLLNNEGKVEYHIGNSQGGNAISLSSEVLQSNEWYMISASFDDSNKATKLYLNGELQEEGNASNGIISTTEPLMLSFYYDSEPQWVYGLLDDLTVYDTILDSETISELYTNDGYSAEDKEILLQIKAENDTNNRLNFSNDPIYWTGITWTSDSPKRVSGFDSYNKLLSGAISFEGLSELKNLSIAHNTNISNINIQGLDQLESIDIRYTNLMQIDLSEAVNLSILNAYGCNLNQLDVSNNTALTSLAANYNNLRFSTIIMGDVNPSNLSLRPQNDIEVTSSLELNEYLDLSAENINNNTVYTLYYNNGSEVESAYYSVSNGIISFSEELVGQMLYCTMENIAFPMFTGDYRLKTSVFRVTPLYEDMEVNAPFLETFSGGQTSYDYYEITGDFDVNYGSNWAYFNFYSISSGNISEFTLPPIQLSALTNPVLSFKSYRNSGQFSTRNDAVEIKVSSDRGESWTSIWSASASELSTGSGGTQPGSISDFLQNPQINLSGLGSSVLIKFIGTSGYGTDWSFTNISVDELDMPVTIEGQAMYDQTLSASYVETIGFDAISIQWYRNNEVIENATTSSYTIVEEDINNELKVVVMLNNQIEVESNVVTPTKASVDAPDAPTALQIEANSITLNLINNYEYRLGTDGIWTNDPIFDGLTSDTEYSFYQRVAESNTHFASEASDALTISTAVATSIDETKLGFLVYPNPTHGTIKISGAKNEYIKIFTLSGKLLSKYQSTAELFDVDLSHLDNGVYLLMIGNTTHKIVKH